MELRQRLKAEHDILERIARGAPLAETLEALVLLIERESENIICSVLLLDAKEGRLRHGAAPSLPRPYVERLDGSKIGPTEGSCGAAAATGESVIVEDVLTHPNWTEYRDLALAHGLRACWSTPISSAEGEVLGTFANYYKTPRAPTPEEREWVEVATHLAAIAIGRSRTTEAIQRAEAHAHHVSRIYAVASSVSELLVRPRQPAELYDAACRIAAEKGHARLAWIGEYDEATDTLRATARHGEASDYAADLTLHLRSPGFERSPAARALATNTPTIANDIANDPTFRWREQTRVHGLRSCAVFPIIVAGERPAIFAIYGAETGFFDDEVVEVLGALARNIGFAIAVGRGSLERERLIEKLNERVQQMTVVHAVARRLQQDNRLDADVLNALIETLRPGLRHPSLCEIRLRWKDIVAQTPLYRETEWRRQKPIGADGMLELAYRDPPPSGDVFPLDEREFFRSLADMFGSHFARVTAESELREREEQLRLVHEVMESARTANDPTVFMTSALALVGEQLGASRVVYAAIDFAADRCTVLQDFTRSCASLVGEHPLAECGPALAASVPTAAPFVLDDAAAPFPELAPRLADLSIRSLVAARLDDRFWLVVHRDRAKAWTKHEVALIREVAERCRLAIDGMEAERRLRKSEAQLQLASSLAKIGGWTVDLVSRRLHWSDQLFALHDLPVGASPKLRDALASCAPEFRPIATAAFDACMRDGTPFDLVLQMTTATDRRIWIRAIGTAERDASGAVVRVHGALQDIDDRRRLEDQLRQSQKMEAVGRLAGGIAHDFNNLLSVILSYSAYMLDGMTPSDPARGDLEQIFGAGKRASDLTRQLLTFSRQQASSPRHLDLARVVAGIEKMLRRVLEKNITLAIVAPERIGSVFADRGQLEQVIMNLVVNARDAVGPDGKITIEIAEATLDASYAAEHHDVAAGRHVMLAVSDDGHGMDEATRSKIFEPFFTTKEKSKGTGLGLATVYGIVKQSGGHIWVYSEPNVGTTFKVYLPLVDAPPDSEPSSAVTSSGKIQPHGMETILLVEDAEQLRAIASAILRRAGYTVLDAASGEAAIAASEAHPGRIDLLVTDVILPRLHGRDLAQKLTARRPELRVLYMSGYGPDAVVQHGMLDAGALFLEKPITPDSLLKKVREALRRGGASETKPGNILHVDDDETLIVLIARILGRLGYKVSGFTDPTEAIRAFTEDPARYQAVVTDVEMPGMSGFDLVRELRAIRPNIPVVVTSGAFRAGDVAAAKELALHSLVTKPNTVDELGQALLAELRRQR